MLSREYTAPEDIADALGKVVSYYWDSEADVILRARILMARYRGGIVVDDAKEAFRDEMKGRTTPDQVACGQGAAAAVSAEVWDRGNVVPSDDDFDDPPRAWALAVDTDNMFAELYAGMDDLGLHVMWRYIHDWQRLMTPAAEEGDG